MAKITIEDILRKLGATQDDKTINKWNTNGSPNFFCCNIYQLHEHSLYIRVMKGPKAGTVGQIVEIESSKNTHNRECFFNEDITISYITEQVYNCNSKVRRIKLSQVEIFDKKPGKLVWINKTKGVGVTKIYRHQNFLGQIIEPGVFVAFRNDELYNIGVGKVTKTGPKRIGITLGDKLHYSHPNNIVVIPNDEELQEELAFRRLQGWDGSLWEVEDSEVIEVIEQ